MSSPIRRSMRYAFVILLLVGCSQEQKVALADDPPKPFIGRVVKIADGDTVTVLYKETQHRIRLAEIDAPESKQPFSAKSKQALGDKVFAKDVKVDWKKRDRYNRIIGNIYLEDRWINK